MVFRSNFGKDLIGTNDFTISRLSNRIFIKLHKNNDKLLLGNYSSVERAKKVADMILRDIESNVDIVDVPHE